MQFVAALLADVNVPIAHSEHTTLATGVAVVLTNEPAAHSVVGLHTLNPLTSAYVPAPHVVHDVAMLADGVNVPVGHTVHVRSVLAVPVEFMYDPAGHVCCDLHAVRPFTSA